MQTYAPMDTNTEALLCGYLSRDQPKKYTAVLIVLISYLLQCSPPRKAHCLPDGNAFRPEFLWLFEREQVSIKNKN